MRHPGVAPNLASHTLDVLDAEDGEVDRQRRLLHLDGRGLNPAPNSFLIADPMGKTRGFMDYGGPGEDVLSDKSKHP